ncbi:type VI secretion system-associated protein TagO [Zobellella sp. DQSA1]|uniref:type VI secretion system-associated protein TagO n=1 Tax=Zobellella sp. DQSA1 TaxID=3342386 RepID=UPI0035BEE14E
MKTKHKGKISIKSKSNLLFLLLFFLGGALFSPHSLSANVLHNENMEYCKREIKNNIDYSVWFLSGSHVKTNGSTNEYEIKGVEQDSFLCKMVDNERIEIYRNDESPILLTNKKMEEVIKQQENKMKKVGNWFRQEEVSLFDDSKTVAIFVRSESDIKSGVGTDVYPWLYIRCMENTTSLYVIWNAFIGVDVTEVTYRIDDGKAVKKIWDVSTDHKSTGLWIGSKSIPLIKEMLGSERFVVRVIPYASSPETAIFPIAGLQSWINEIRSLCSW